MMRRTLSLTLALLLASWATLAVPADEPQQQRVPGNYDWVVDDDPNPLPAYLTPQERQIPLPPPGQRLGGRTPPAGAVHCPAEYEPADGLLIRWGSYTSILTEMTVGLTTLDPSAVMYVIVSGPSQESSARSTLQSAGADLTQVEFIQTATDTVWIRDYGPRFIIEDGLRAIVDHNYNRPRPNDNAVPAFIGQLWNEDVYEIPLTHGGGNFHLFSNGDAFMTELILNENSGLSEQDVIDYYHDYQNVNLTITDALPTNVDSTQHIDMWMLPTGDDEIIIGEYTFDPPRQITDGVAADLSAQGYTVRRTPGWTSGGTHYTYTNAVVVNNLVFMSEFLVSQDSQALTVFQEAFPSHTVQQIDCRSIITAAGALHCIVMHVPTVIVSPIPSVKVHTPDGGELLGVGDPYDITWTASDDVGVTGIDIYYSTDSGGTYPYTIATGEPNDGVHPWTVPNTPSNQCRVKVVAHDADENSGEDSSNADFTITNTPPRVVYSFDMDDDPGWSTEGLWAWGQPTGGGGQYGNPDPTSGYTGDNVYGYNLSGDYENSLPERHLTSTALDCSELSEVRLKFWRYLGVEQPLYDHAYVRVSTNGSNWTTVWENSGTITDLAWSQHEFDISAIADGQPTVYVRWTMGTTDSAWQYCGWNIDDVEIWAIAPPEYQAGDLNCDGAINGFDIDPFVLIIGSEPPYTDYYTQYPQCDHMLADINDDGQVNGFDIDPFVALLGG